MSCRVASHRVAANVHARLIATRPHISLTSRHHASLGPGEKLKHNLSVPDNLKNRLDDMDIQRDTGMVRVNPPLPPFPLSLLSKESFPPEPSLFHQSHPCNAHRDINRCLVPPTSNRSHLQVKKLSSNSLAALDEASSNPAVMLGAGAAGDDEAPSF